MRLPGISLKERSIVLKNILKVLNHTEEILLSISFSIMAIVCFVQVITRYFFHYSMPWSEELLRALFVWSSCLGISLGFKTRSHLGVDAVVNLFPKKLKKILSLLAYFVVLACCVVLIYYSFQVSLKQYQTLQKTIAMRLPIFYISAALPVGFVLTVIRVLQVMYEDFIVKKKDDDKTHISEGLL